MRDAPSASLPLRPVWDIPTRLFHWILLAAVVVAASTGLLLLPVWLNLHLWAGTVIIVLLLFRLVWGFTGSTHSRFASFLYAPQTILDHLRGLLAGKSEHATGHNPVGAVMIFTLLGVLTLLAASGLIIVGGLDKEGPLRGVMSYAAAAPLREVHELLAYALLALAAGHVAGVAMESVRSRFNLVRGMIDGLKPAPATEPLNPSRTSAFIVAAALLGATATAATAYLWRMPPAGVPTSALDQTYVKECGDCHVPFHPSLRGEHPWGTIMAGLSDHFGEDASLNETVTAQLSAYLKANAAEHFDTRAANVFRAPEPLKITETKFWTFRHADMPAAVFQQKNVGTKSNCEACHGDARQGLFMPQAIHVPKE